MKFDLKTPCSACPFRSDIEFYLSEERVRQIWDECVIGEYTFACHKTVQYDDDGEQLYTNNEQHCAGALIAGLKNDNLNQMARIAERIGMFDPDKLDLDAPVFDDVDDMEHARTSAYRKEQTCAVHR